MAIASAQVSWQTAFWTLAFLAINVMAQPCGRVCSFKSKYRPYLRCSPFVCVADCLSLLFRLLIMGFGISVVGRVIPLRDRLQLVIRCRFIDENDKVEEIRTTWPWLRWLFFFFGTLTSKMKLLSWEGMPCTKAYGIMFLSSFVIIQVMLMFSSIYRQQNQGSPVLDSRDDKELVEAVEEELHRKDPVRFRMYRQQGSPALDYRNKKLVEAIEEDLQVIDTVLFRLAAFLHLIFLLSIVGDFWPDSNMPPKSIGFDDPEIMPRLIVKFFTCFYKIFWITILWVIWGWIPPFLYLAYCMDLEQKRYVDIYEWIVFGFLLCWVLPVSVWTYFCYWAFGGFVFLMLDMAWYCGILFSVFFCLFILRALSSRFPSLGVGLMLLEPDKKALDRHGSHLLTAFLHTVALSAIWYAFRYDPTRLN